MKAALFDLMRVSGIAEVRIEFSGGDDDGGVDNVIVTRLLTSTDAQKAQIVQGALAGEEAVVLTEFQDMCSELVGAEYGGFAGSFSVSGNLIVNAEKRTVIQEAHEDPNNDDD